MDAARIPFKNLSRIAVTAMGALFILGCIFYKERALFSDAAFKLFNIISYSKFDIPGKRYGAVIVQVLPFLAFKLHLSVNTIIFLFGAGYYLFYFSIVALTVYRYKLYPLAILMVLYFFLFVSESYIWVGDAFTGTAWMFLFFAVTLYLGNKKVNILLLIVPFSLLAFLTFSVHFVTIIPMTFLWVYLIIGKKYWPFSKNHTILLCCLLIFIIGLKFAITDSAYDNIQLHGVTHFSLLDIIDSFQTPTVKIFFYRCIVNYWLGTLVFLISMITLIRSKERILAIWTFISAVGYVIIMGLAYKNLDSTTLLFHIESEWACIGIIVATPFVFTYLPKLKTLRAVWLLSGIFIIRLIYIITFLLAFSLRNTMEEQILNRMRKKGITKLVLFNDSHLLSVFRLDWALPYESIMESAIEGDKQQLTFFIINADDKKILGKLNDPKSFFDAFYITPCSVLNKEYFNLDTTKPYQIMTYSELIK